MVEVILLIGMIMWLAYQQQANLPCSKQCINEQCTCMYRVCMHSNIFLAYQGGRVASPTKKRKTLHYWVASNHDVVVTVVYIQTVQSYILGT